LILFGWQLKLDDKRLVAFGVLSKAAAELSNSVRCPLLPQADIARMSFHHGPPGQDLAKASKVTKFQFVSATGPIKGGTFCIVAECHCIFSGSQQLTLSRMRARSCPAVKRSSLSPRKLRAICLETSGVRMSVEWQLS
jgi:hypothetical protein